MSDREPHCPFLNRADHRCSSYFSIERLQHAFEHCFHAYKSCEVYQELLVERQARRQAAAGGHGNDAGQFNQFVWTTACRPAEGDVKPRTTHRNPFVQIRLPSVAVHNPGHAADAAPRQTAV